MNRGIVKLHALPDPDRPGAEDDDLFPVGQTAVVFSGIGGVEIGNVFPGMQGIHHAEYRHNAEFLATRIELCLFQVPGFRDPAVGEAHLLGRTERFRIVDLQLQFCLHVRNALERFEEELRDHGNLVQHLNGRAAAQQFHDGIDVVVPEFPDIVKKFAVAAAVEFGTVQVIYAGLQ